MKLTRVVVSISLVAAKLWVRKTPTAGAATAPNAGFERMKAAVGDGNPKPNGSILRNSFRIFGEGSALLHLEKPEGRQEIITIFYPVGDELRADHYCFMKNQPRYIAKPSSDPNVIEFEFRDITTLTHRPATRTCTRPHGGSWTQPYDPGLACMGRRQRNQGRQARVHAGEIAALSD